MIRRFTFYIYRCLADRGDTVVCKGCGKEIEDGQEYCDACAGIEDDAEVIRITRDDLKKLNRKEPRLKAEGLFLDLEGYARSLRGDFTNILALLGAVLLYLAPFCSWMKREDRNGTQWGSLFDVGGKNAELAVHQNVLIVCSVVILLMAVSMLVFSARENIRPLRPYADAYLLRLIPVVPGIAAYIVILKNSAYSAALAVSGTSPGIGKIICAVGLIVYTLSVIFDRFREKSM